MENSLQEYVLIEVKPLITLDTGLMFGLVGLVVVLVAVLPKRRWTQLSSLITGAGLGFLAISIYSYHVITTEASPEQYARVRDVAAAFNATDNIDASSEYRELVNAYLNDSSLSINEYFVLVDYYRKARKLGLLREVPTHLREPEAIIDDVKGYFESKVEK